MAMLQYPEPLIASQGWSNRYNGRDGERRRTRSHMTEEDKREAAIISLLNVKMSFTRLTARRKQSILINRR